MTWQNGLVIKGGGDTYTIEKTLGVGGFGVSYRARNKHNELVVIKTLNDKMQNDSEFDGWHEKFVQEAFLLKGCKGGPHIVKVFAVFQYAENPDQDKKLWCMVMEYIEGRSLWEQIEKNGPLPEAKALFYIRHIGKALSYMHSRDEPVLHRDLNPKNIMLRRDPDEAVLIDFGLAREFTPGQTQTQTAMGFQGFAPIEQYVKRYQRTAATDVYGLAAASYFALTGATPIPSLEIQAGTKQIPPKRVNSKISDRVNKAILRGMKLKPEDRPQSVVAWVKEIGSVTQPEPSNTIQVEPVVSITRSLPKGSLLSTIGLLALWGLVFTFAKPSALQWEVILRGVMMMSFSPTFGVVGYQLEKTHWWGKWYSKLIIFLIFGGLVGLATGWCLWPAYVTGKMEFSALALAVAVVGAVAGAWAGAGAGAWAVAGAVAMAGAVALALAGAGALAMAGAVALALAGAVAWAGAWVVALAVAGAGAVAGVGATDKMCQQKYPWWQIQLFVGGAILGGFGVGVVLGKLFGA